MSTKSFLMAVDGGATKTTLVLYSTTGQKLFEKTSTGTNFHAIGTGKVERVISELLLESHDAVQYDKLAIAVFAMAGIDTEHDLTTMKEIISNAFEKVAIHCDKIIVENDVLSALIGVTGGKPGALILSGTGSIAYAMDRQGNIVRVGGYGHRAADEGSGYWIGQQIIRAVVQYEDGRIHTPTILKELLYKKLQVKNLEEMLAWLYHPNYSNAQVASISSILIEAVQLGDEIALEIADKAASELAILAMATLEKLDTISPPFTMYLNGGILQNHPIIRESFIQKMHDIHPMLSFELCCDQPISYIVNRAFSSL